jgi:hypothetical protein
VTRGCWSLALVALACAADAGSARNSEPPQVRNFGRPAGMPIGAGGAAPSDELPPQLTGSDVSIPAVEAASAQAQVPCAGCVELNVYVNDINQRDQFSFAVDGLRVSRVVWTLLISLNSDQLAVQPFIDEQRGKYTNLHVNTFPLGRPVELEQVFKGKARSIGLVVGSSGAWTGNQVMSVFVDSVRVEGPDGAVSLSKSFDTSADGLEPRTHEHEGKLVFHPEARAQALAPP